MIRNMRRRRKFWYFRVPKRGLLRGKREFGGPKIEVGSHTLIPPLLSQLRSAEGEVLIHGIKLIQDAVSVFKNIWGFAIYFDFKIENFYEGVVRFDFKTLCDQNLGAEDYLEIIKNCTFIVIDKIPQFDNFNSNQQQRFITLLDIIYDNSIPIAVTADQSLDKFTSSKLLEKPFERTISRLYELTSKAMNS